MKLALRSSLLTLAVILCAFAPAHSQSWSLFGGKGRAASRYSIVEEYKEAYRPGGGWFGSKGKKKVGRHSAPRLKHRVASRW